MQRPRPRLRLRLLSGAPLRAGRVRELAALVGLFLAALTLRLVARITYDEDIDALRFALGVERFDVTELRPHAPFYPVYVAVAKIVALGSSPRTALGIVNAVAGSVVVVAIALLAREVIGRRGAVLAGAMALASPFLWLTSQKLLSDMAGTAFTTVAIWMCVRARASLHDEHAPGRAARWRTAALITLGVGLGVRLSYFPIALACLGVVVWQERLGWRGFLARARDLAAGVMLWLIPLVILARPRPLVAVLWVQGVGHFTRWGGSAITVPSPLDRLHGIVWGAWANVLGGAWLDAPPLRWIAAPILAALVIAAATRVRGLSRRQPELAAAAAAYFLWAALGQNIAYKPRHLLPLAPLMIVALAAVADRIVARYRPAIAAVALLVVQWLVDGAALVRAHLDPSPAAAIVLHLRQTCGARPVLTRELGRMIAEGAPACSIAQPRDEAELLRAVLAAKTEGTLITSEALPAAARRELITRGYTLRVAFARPRSRYVDSLWHELALLEVSPQPP